MPDQRIEDIFEAAVSRRSPPERDAYLEGACAGNAELRGRVEALLRAHEQAGNFLQATSASPATIDAPGARIGRYRLLQRIGEGGFGVVFMAEQLEPVRRKVALKVIKLGMETAQVVARFESERQALALMSHASIAAVLDGGATETGRPYFVMELVKGIPITEYCDQHHLAARERLRLFVQVCHAVQHAHQKGVIHRDIKPSNVLVTVLDGRPLPKVIDFGIAKATHQRLTEKTLFTEFRQFVGTPQYMSPEQAEMSGLDVDTRCDIYSLGVLLYELLTSTTPFEAERLRNLGYPELQRVIREEDPPPPSERLSTLKENLTQVARQRGADPARLRGSLRGELDWIVMKSLEKDRTRRYATAAELADDVERYLRNEPVLAGPVSLLYRARKYLRRHRVAVAAAGVVCLALLAGMAAAAAGFVRAHREAARASAIASFLEEMFASVDLGAEAGAEEVGRVVARARAMFGENHVTVAAALGSLAARAQQAGNFQAARPLYEEAIRIWRSQAGQPGSPLAQALCQLGKLLRATGDEQGAERALRASLDIVATFPESSQAAHFETRTELAASLQRKGALGEAQAHLQDALNSLRRSGQAREYQVSGTLEQLVQVLVLQNKIDEASGAFEEMIAVNQRLFPKESHSLAFQYMAFGHWLRQHGRIEQAEPWLREALRIYRQVPDPPREYYLVALDGLFQIIRRREDRIDESIKVFHETMQVMASIYGRDSPLLAPHLMGFAQALEARNRAVDAIPLVVDGMRIARAAAGAAWDPQRALQTLEPLVWRVALANDLTPAAYEAASQGCQALLAEQPGEPRFVLLRGVVMLRLGRYDEALADLDPDSATGEAAAGDGDRLRLAFASMARARLGQQQRAARLLELAREAPTAEATPRQASAALAEAEAALAGPATR